MHSCILWLLCTLVLFCLQHCVASKKHGVKHHSHHHHQQEQPQPHCFTKDQLSDMPDDWMQQFSGSTLTWDRYSAVARVSDLENMEGDKKRRRRHTDNKCPSFKSISHDDLKGLSERSISPWRYRIDEDENRYPQKLAFAECLCSGCISMRTGEESASLESVVLEQTMMVLRRKPCPRKPCDRKPCPHVPPTFTFEVDYIKVPVGCTCAVPRH